MLKIIFLFLASAFIFTGCENLVTNEAGNTIETDSGASETETGTWANFVNHNNFFVNVCRDPARQSVVTQVQANDSKKIKATPNTAGVVFYLDYQLDLFDIPDLTIPYNGPNIVTIIEEGKTNLVPIPQLESININVAYVRVINTGFFSLSFTQDNREKSPLWGFSIIVPEQEAVYEVPPGSSSNYSIMRNTTAPVDWPVDFTFKPGIIYEITYNGSSLLIEEKLISNIIRPVIPENVVVKKVTLEDIKLGWNDVRDAEGYNIYRASSENSSYTKINPSIVGTVEYTDSDILPYKSYYYKITSIVTGVESGFSDFVLANSGILAEGRNLTEKLNWLKSHAESNNFYGIELYPSESCVPQTLSYSGKSDITIMLSGSENETACTITLLANGSLFEISSGVTLILDNNISLIGRNGNNDALVTVANGGTMIMNAGSKITGNKNISITTTGYGGGIRNTGMLILNGGEVSDNSGSSGGGVFNAGIFTMNNGKISGNVSSSLGGGVFSQGTFYMKDGEISSNRANTRGGGVHSSGIFQMGGGVIYGSNASLELRNTASTYAAYYWLSGTRQYGVFYGDIFYTTGNLDNANDSIRIINGYMQTN